jgi:hypothetical protein
MMHVPYVQLRNGKTSVICSEGSAELVLIAWDLLLAAQSLLSLSALSRHYFAALEATINVLTFHFNLYNRA